MSSRSMRTTPFGTRSLEVFWVFVIMLTSWKLNWLTKKFEMNVNKDNKVLQKGNNSR